MFGITRKDIEYGKLISIIIAFTVVTVAHFQLGVPTVVYWVTSFLLGFVHDGIFDTVKSWINQAR